MYSAVLGTYTTDVRLIPRELRETVSALSRIAYCNPFLAERIDLEQQILRSEFTPFFPVWSRRTDVEDDNPNVLRISERAQSIAERLRERLSSGAQPNEEERGLYQDLCLYALYYRYQERLYEMITQPRGKDGARRSPFYREFRRDLGRLLDDPAVRLPRDQTPEHIFACFFQVRRAFYNTFHSITGASMPAAQLRAHVWQSIFTHDGRRYQRGLYKRMGDVTTLITGPSGAGKELVARAIGLARYIPFDSGSNRFRESYEESFFPLNLSALSTTLIESELFGHRRGSFTGAVVDRSGWLEVCPPLGTVFLDEIGEIDITIQVKLLRVLETRVFQPLGSTDEHRFHGKVVTATNRNLGREMREGRFREDLYYRLCADAVVTPSLQERLADSPDELSTLVRFLAERLVGEQEAPALAQEAEQWIVGHLGTDYAWPGNVRELSQCVSNFLIRRDYRPLPSVEPPSGRDRLAAEFLDGALSAEELLRAYCTLVYERTGSYVAAAKRLGMDRRTVRSRVDPDLLARLRGS